MNLPYDVARCNGHWQALPFAKQLDAVCIDCQRRTDKSTGERQPWMQGEVLDGICSNKIEGDEK
jgi:hypothetical protein